MKPKNLTQLNDPTFWISRSNQNTTHGSLGLNSGNLKASSKTQEGRREANKSRDFNFEPSWDFTTIDNRIFFSWPPGRRMKDQINGNKHDATYVPMRMYVQIVVKDVLLGLLFSFVMATVMTRTKHIRRLSNVRNSGIDTRIRIWFQNMPNCDKDIMCIDAHMSHHSQGQLCRTPDDRYTKVRRYRLLRDNNWSIKI